MHSPTDVLLLTVAGDIHLKSARTQRRLRRTLRDNLELALARAAPSARLGDAPRGRLLVEADPGELDAAADAAARVAGIFRVTRATRTSAPTFDALVALGADFGHGQVAGRRFAVRVRRRGSHDWSSIDAERAIGAALVAGSAGVDLSQPDVEVRLEVFDDDVYLLDSSREGCDGLPVGTQDRVLSLHSGGFDSPVAAWMMLRRGCPVDFVHFMMDCSQSDHALAVAYGLADRWAIGADPLCWIVDFTEVKESLVRDVENRQRQVVLKQLMFIAADALAARLHLPALVTGEAVGQVSTQTVANLAEIDRVCTRTVLRPLAGLTKNEILEWARRCGTHDLSARAKEVCNLATGPVEVAARRRHLERARAALPDDLVSRALAERRVIRLADWMPGTPLVTVLEQPPAGWTLVGSHDDVPDRGPVAITGTDAARRASRLVAAGREAVVVDAPLRGSVRLAG